MVRVMVRVMVRAKVRVRARVQIAKVRVRDSGFNLGLTSMNYTNHCTRCCTCPSHSF